MMQRNWYYCRQFSLECMPHSRWNIEYSFLRLPWLLESNYLECKTFFGRPCSEIYWSSSTRPEIQGLTRFVSQWFDTSKNFCSQYWHMVLVFGKNGASTNYTFWILYSVGLGLISTPSTRNGRDCRIPYSRSCGLQMSYTLRLVEESGCKWKTLS